MPTLAEQDKLIEVEQIKLFYRQIARVLFPVSAVLAALAYIIAQNVNAIWPLLWASGLFALHVVRIAIVRRELKRESSIDEQIRRSRLTLGLTALFGATIGTGIFLFFPGLSSETQTLVTMICVGWLAGAVGGSGAYPTFFRTYGVAFTIPLITAWLLYGGAHGWIIAMLVTLLFLYLWMTVRDIGQKTVDSIRIRFENLELLDELKARQKDLEEASTAKSRFLAAASHDLRQPLMSINLLHGSLLRAADVDSVTTLVQKLNAPVRALESILDSLLEISRIDAGAIVPRTEDVDLSTLARSLEEEFAPRAQSPTIELSVSADPCTVGIDGHLTSRIVRNLIDNAFKFTDRGAVSMRLAYANGSLQITVTDSGVGIGQDALPHIFDEYYQVANPHRARAQGLGLGLTIVKRLVALQHGVIAVESELGRGTTFRISLPASKPVAETIERSREEASDTAPSLASLRMLLIEDDPDIQDAVALWSNRCGIETWFAGDADEALNSAASLPAPPQIIVSDYRLPGSIDGLALITMLRQRWPDVPAILLTGDTDSSLAAEAGKRNAVYLRKPVAAEQLEAVIRRLAVKERAILTLDAKPS